MKKILILFLGFLLTLSIFGKNREFNPAIRDAIETKLLLDELRAEGYTVLPEVVVVAYRNEQDTVRKEFRHQRGPAFLNDTLKKGFPEREFKGRPEFGRSQFGRPEFGRPQFNRGEFRGRPEFGNMRKGEMKRDMRKMDCPCLDKKSPKDPIKPPTA